MQRDLYTADHEAFRATVREFISRHVEPHYDDWEKAGIAPREAWIEAGRQGLLGTDIDEKYGGGGIKDFRYNAIIRSELAKEDALIQQAIQQGKEPSTAFDTLGDDRWLVKDPNSHLPP